ncbi:MAG TPA: ComF family protein [Candidatus Nitrosopolaris sp.]|nr:ComF family protein [Candidatus Nitrosopolaris sp.]
MPYWLRVLRDCIFPASCEACEAPLYVGHATSLCAACLASMGPLCPPLCAVCGVPLRAGAGILCRGCVLHPPAFSTAHATTLYRAAPAGANALAIAVQALKYRRRRIVAQSLGALLAEHYPFDRDALLVPVPLHPHRLRERGFNQALLLARVLGRRRGLAVAARALIRKRHTRAQPGLAAEERRRNLRGAFAVTSPAIVRGRHIVLVDDVLTTGATADACARSLLAAGATRVDAYTVGRAP